MDKDDPRVKSMYKSLMSQFGGIFDNHGVDSDILTAEGSLPKLM
jgi:hypothetical protein